MLTRLAPLEREDAIARVRALISAGNYGPGDRLPPERELIDHLAMSRSTLRKALEVLERDGVIWRHVGKGTFIAGVDGAAGLGNIADLSRQLTPVRMMRARLCIEPAIAREAAINASKEAIIRMKLAKEGARVAPNWADYETHDDLFHRSIAEASDNILLVALFDKLNQVRRAIAWGNVVRNSDRPPDEHSSFIEHDRIAETIEAHNPGAAQKAMRQHICSVSGRLFEEV
ncbi:MAG: FadR/GntR family transcriptional regulator [Hyphomicrobiales bacterium]